MKDAPPLDVRVEREKPPTCSCSRRTSTATRPARLDVTIIVPMIAMIADRQNSLDAMWNALRAAKRSAGQWSRVGSSTSVVETLDYYPFGSARLDTTIGAYAGASRKFIGQFYDAATA